MGIDEEGARVIAIEHLANPDWEPAVTKIEDAGDTWRVFYNSRIYVETGSFSHALAGNLPLLVSKAAGSVETDLSFLPPGHPARSALDRGSRIGQPGAMVHADLVEALDVVLADVSASGIRLDVRDDRNWHDDLGELRAMVGAPDGSGVGISVPSDWSLPARIAELADQVQEIAIEARWASGMSATWPECPLHPNSHPLESRFVEGRAVWRCPKSGTAIAEVGTLSA